MVDISRDLADVISRHGVKEGRLTAFVPHTTAGITINEHADPDVASDILAFFDDAVPWERGWRHGEGNSAAHVKTTLTGSSVSVEIRGGRLRLGTWQGIFFCEFDGPRVRKVWVTLEDRGS
jgi:secondary thiamine-phosphate synthase enzyme